jgi:hypothetical protein
MPFFVCDTISFGTRFDKPADGPFRKAGLASNLRETESALPHFNDGACSFNCSIQQTLE